jgi:hypothetical protein
VGASDIDYQHIHSGFTWFSADFGIARYVCPIVPSRSRVMESGSTAEAAGGDTLAPNDGCIRGDAKVWVDTMVQLVGLPPHGLIKVCFNTN